MGSPLLAEAPPSPKGVEHPNQEGGTNTVQEPLDQGLKLSMAGTFSQSKPTIDPPKVCTSHLLAYKMHFVSLFFSSKLMHSH